MPFQIAIRRWFAASHQLRLSDGSLEPLHGHNWQVRLVVSRQDSGLDAIGTVHDFHDIQGRLDQILAGLHNTHLNEALAEVNPTTEQVARHIGRSMPLPPELRLVEVEVWETADCSAIWSPEGLAPQ